MPSRPTSRRVDAAPPARIAAQQARIAALEVDLWQANLDAAALAAYQQAHRDLEALIAASGDDRRHAFVVVIPVADSPRQLEACLDSLLVLCRTYGYGGMRNGRFARVSVLLADDSADAAASAAHQALAARTTALGIEVEYFGTAQQLALLARIDAPRLAPVIGRHDPAAFGRKGQATMRNIAQLRLAEIAGQRRDPKLIFYTVDVDQTFQVCVPAEDGRDERYAISYLHALDRLFERHDIAILTGKVVGDPPVSPAVMAANFLDDVEHFLQSMTNAAPDARYQQPLGDGRAGAAAAYHDMAELFGFSGKVPAYRYRCALPGDPDNLACFADFAGRLQGFFHGAHPTRTTWYARDAEGADPVAARTVYTGNTAFTPAALDWFIPFAPLRLRMSGPTLGRLLKAELGGRFVSANLPMLHARVLADTGAAEYRPGVIMQGQRIDLADEFERQFYGDRMLFSIERLVDLGFPADRPTREQVVASLALVGRDLRERYAARQVHVTAGTRRVETLLRAASAWWQTRPEMAAACAAFEHFVDNLHYNFGADAAGLRRIDDPARRHSWDAQQAAAIVHLAADRLSWRAALRALRSD